MGFTLSNPSLNMIFFMWISYPFQYHQNDQHCPKMFGQNNSSCTLLLLIHHTNLDKYTYRGSFIIPVAKYSLIPLQTSNKLERLMSTKLSHEFWSIDATIESQVFVQRCPFVHVLLSMLWCHDITVLMSMLFCQCHEITVLMSM